LSLKIADPTCHVWNYSHVTRIARKFVHVLKELCHITILVHISNFVHISNHVHVIIHLKEIGAYHGI
jgi:hypothetical protein